MVCGSHLLTHSDSGFSKEQEKGYGIRGANYIRCGKSGTDGVQTGGPRQTAAGASQPQVVHLLESLCRSHKHVTRSSFGSECLALVAATDSMIPLALTLHEVAKGSISASEARRLREEGGLAYRLTVATDNLGLFTATTSTTVKIPAERSLAGHLFWLRELLDHRVINTLQWVDTRDMTADCHTKGSVDRQAILDLMAGRLKLNHEIKEFSSPAARTDCP